MNHRPVTGLNEQRFTLQLAMGPNLQRIVWYVRSSNSMSRTLWHHPKLTSPIMRLACVTSCVWISIPIGLQYRLCMCARLSFDPQPHTSSSEIEFPTRFCALFLTSLNLGGIQTSSFMPKRTSMIIIVWCIWPDRCLVNIISSFITRPNSSFSEAAACVCN